MNVHVYELLCYTIKALRYWRKYSATYLKFQPPSPHSPALIFAPLMGKYSKSAGE